MPRMINPLMAVLLSAVLFTCAGCAIISQIAAAMPTSRTASPSSPSAPAVSSAPATRFTGDGGRGIRLAVLVPTAANLASDQNYLPTMVQGELVTNLSSYSAISVLDRLRLETVLKETESGIYKNEEDFGRLGKIANVDYVLTGSITRTSTGHTLQLQIVGTGGDTIGVTRAAYSGTPTVAEMDNFTGIRRASLELLAQMGVTLTDAARNELSGAASADRVNAQTSLAQGIIAQRGGTEIAALSYFFQAAAIDPSLAEAANWSSILAANISSGNIGEDVRNEIQWRRDWIARLTETEQYFDSFNRTESMPYTLFYSDGIIRGQTNYQNETVVLSVGTNLRSNRIWASSVERALQSVYNGLERTGKKIDWGLRHWPRQSVTNLNPFNAVQGRRFTIVVELVNSRNQVIGRQTLQTGGNWRFDMGGLEDTPRVPVSNDDRQTTSFTVKADDITDRLTIRIASVDGQNAETMARNGVLQILAVSAAKWENYDNVRVVVESGPGFRGFGFTDTLIIDDFWGEPITSIRDYALEGHVLSKDVIIGDSVIRIGNRAFGLDVNASTRDIGLTGVTIGNSVEFIGNGAFENNRLTRVTIPNSVTTISDNAFRGNDLTSVTIPESVTFIGESAFIGSMRLWATELTSITIGAGVSMSPSSFRNGFVSFYQNNRQRAGTYTYNPDRRKWSYSAR